MLSRTPSYSLQCPSKCSELDALLLRADEPTRSVESMEDHSRGAGARRRFTATYKEGRAVAKRSNLPLDIQTC